jgi:hypothetical protein
MMNTQTLAPATRMKPDLGTPADASIAPLVGRVYEAASMRERQRLLTCLMKPVGVLALMVVANGLFAKYWFRGGRPEAPVRLDDISNIAVADVVALVRHVEQAGVGFVPELVRVVLDSPDIATIAPAAALLAFLMRRERAKRAARTGPAAIGANIELR